MKKGSRMAKLLRWSLGLGLVVIAYHHQSDSAFLLGSFVVLGAWWLLGREAYHSGK